MWCRLLRNMCGPRFRNLPSQRSQRSQSVAKCDSTASLSPRRCVPFCCHQSRCQRNISAWSQISGPQSHSGMQLLWRVTFYNTRGRFVTWGIRGSKQKTYSNEHMMFDSLTAAVSTCFALYGFVSQTLSTQTVLDGLQLCFQVVLKISRARLIL